MARVYERAYWGGKVVPVGEASLSITSAAVLYGLSVYTVFPVCKTKEGLRAFRLADHFQRLVNSCRIIGMDTFEKEWTKEAFEKAVHELVASNEVHEDVFVRATVHLDASLPGTRSRGVSSALSIFLYEPVPIIPQDGARLKTSVWRRVSDFAIPARAKVNGAYVNSTLARQDALDSGYDDCVLLDASGHVCELSAANIFLVRGGTLITPSTASDILEGINRKTIIEFARDLTIPVVERTVDLTELYVADEVFACGTSSFVAPITEIDKRMVSAGKPGPLTARLRELHAKTLHGDTSTYAHLLSAV